MYIFKYVCIYYKYVTLLYLYYYNILSLSSIVAYHTSSSINTKCVYALVCIYSMSVIFFNNKCV